MVRDIVNVGDKAFFIAMSLGEPDNGFEDFVSSIPERRLRNAFAQTAPACQQMS